MTALAAVLGQLTAFTSLCFTGDGGGSTLVNITSTAWQSLHSLKELHAGWYFGEVCVGLMTALTALEHLRVRVCVQDEPVVSLAAMPNLKSLHVRVVGDTALVLPILQTLREVCTGLTSLSLDPSKYCSDMWSAVGSLPKLRQLQLHAFSMHEQPCICPIGTTLEKLFLDISLSGVTCLDLSRLGSNFTSLSIRLHHYCEGSRACQMIQKVVAPMPCNLRQLQLEFDAIGKCTAQYVCDPHQLTSVLQPLLPVLDTLALYDLPSNLDSQSVEGKLRSVLPVSADIVLAFTTMYDLDNVVYPDSVLCPNSLSESQRDPVCRKYLSKLCCLHCFTGCLPR